MCIRYILLLCYIYKIHISVSQYTHLYPYPCLCLCLYLSIRYSHFHVCLSHSQLIQEKLPGILQFSSLPPADSTRSDTDGMKTQEVFVFPCNMRGNSRAWPWIHVGSGEETRLKWTASEVTPFPFPPAGDLADPRTEPLSPSLQENSLPLSHWRKSSEIIRVGLNPI